MVLADLNLEGKNMSKKLVFEMSIYIVIGENGLRCYEHIANGKYAESKGKCITMYI